MIFLMILMTVLMNLLVMNFFILIDHIIIDFYIIVIYYVSYSNLTHLIMIYTINIINKILESDYNIKFNIIHFNEINLKVNHMFTFFILFY